MDFILITNSELYFWNYVLYVITPFSCSVFNFLESGLPEATSSFVVTSTANSLH